MKEKYFYVDGYLTHEGQPMLQLWDGRRQHLLTLSHVRSLLGDIHAEIQRLDSERNGDNEGKCADQDN